MNIKLREKITSQGMDPDQVEAEMKRFKKGFSFIELDRPATLQDGIIEIDSTHNKYEEIYQQAARNIEIITFVPASGAASRMFKDLFEFVESNEQSADLSPSINHLITNIKDFAFAKSLDNCLKSNGTSIDKLIRERKHKKLVEFIIGDKGLNCGQLPKGLLQFHKSGEESVTPVEEHFSESIQYAIGKNNKVIIHFTVSPEHLKLFDHKAEQAKQKFPNHKIITSFSQQNSRTNTIAVDLNNEPFIEENGSLLFRPAGHGALLENLNDLDADLVFIKNIDNVVPDRLKEQTVKFKKILAGVLLESQSKSFELLFKLDKGVDDEELEYIEYFAKTQLRIEIPLAFNSWSKEMKEEFLKNKLNRPIRVCGMVKNTGEPGGGPFWVKNKDGDVSLQIVETSQLNLSNSHTMDCISKASHFNPVDLVCGLKNYKGEKFDLLEYRDPNTGFISRKSKNGRVLKALELPGLWNGAMANWNTLFVEVPIITFNPVKRVNDLLRPEHQ